jgi:hypothetical protein
MISLGSGLYDAYGVAEALAGALSMVIISMLVTTRANKSWNFRRLENRVS